MWFWPLKKLISSFVLFFQVYKTSYPENVVYSFTKAVLELSIFEKVELIHKNGYHLQFHHITFLSLDGFNNPQGVNTKEVFSRLHSVTYL